MVVKDPTCSAFCSAVLQNSLLMSNMTCSPKRGQKRCTPTRDQIPFPLFRIATMHTIYLRYHAQVGSGRSVEGNMLPSQVVDSQTLPSHVATRPHPTDPNPTRPETTCPNPIRPNTDPTDRGPTQPDHNSTRRRPDPTQFEPTPTG